MTVFLRYLDRSPMESDLVDVRDLPSRAHKELGKLFPGDECIRRQAIEVPWLGRSKRRD